MTSGGKRWRRYREERAVGIPRSYPPPHSKSIKLTVPLAVLAAADEGRIQGHGDRRSRRIRPHRGLIPKLRTNFQSAQTQSFRVVSGIDREHLPQHVSSRPVSHQGGEMRLKLIQLRRRAAIRWPTMAGFVAAAPGTAKAGKPHRDLAEKRRDRMV